MSLKKALLLFACRARVAEENEILHHLPYAFFLEE